MNKHLLQLSEKVDALSVRERVIIMVTSLALIGFLWWTFFAEPLFANRAVLEKQNAALSSEILVLESTVQAIQRRMSDGVHREKEQKLILLQQALEKANILLAKKTFDLIEPDQMFQLMQQLIFSESNLKVIAIRRKQVTPIFSGGTKPGDSKQNDQPEIYRHVMQMGFEGKYIDVLNYISRLESLEWKLIWDRIELKTNEYPIIRADIEISTLSGNKLWVGL